MKDKIIEILSRRLHKQSHYEPGNIGGYEIPEIAKEIAEMLNATKSGATVVSSTEAIEIIKDVKNLCMKEESTQASMDSRYKLDAKYVSKKMTELFNILRDEAVQNGDAVKLLKGFVNLADKWIPHWNMPLLMKTQIRFTKEYLSRFDG